MRFSCALVLLLVVACFEYSEQLNTVVLADPDSSYSQGALARLCLGRPEATKEQLQQGKCYDKELTKTEFAHAISDISGNRYQVLVMAYLSHNQRPGEDSLDSYPRLRFKEGDQYVMGNNSEVDKLLRKISDKDVLIYVSTSSEDFRESEKKNEVSSIAHALRESVYVKDDKGQYRKLSKRWNDPFSFDWDDVLSVQDSLLDLHSSQQFFTATIKEVAAYMLARKELKDKPEGEILGRGMIFLHSIPGQGTWLDDFSNNQLPRIKKAKHFEDLLPLVIDLAQENQSSKFSNYFTATISKTLIRTFDVIRFCRNGIVRRQDKSTMKFDPVSIRTCMGTEEFKGYDEFLLCCIQKELATNKKEHKQRK